MNILERHEIFEMEVLEKLKSARLVDSLVFGGGTMLRLCHEMKRYSVDLDFWRLKKVSESEILDRFTKLLQKEYEVTDAQVKHFTILIEVRSGSYPKRLKIEVRREILDWDFEEKIAFSRFSSKQVLLKAHTLEQTMRNKIQALLGRGEIRDAFDLEFLMRQGVALPNLTMDERDKLISSVEKFKPHDFKVKLGSVLEPDIRAYYIKNKFHFLQQKFIAVSEK